MFGWTGLLDRTEYTLRCVTAVALLAGTVLLFPFMLAAVVSATHCGLDTCGAVGLLVSANLRPILLVAALAIVLSASIRRARDAGLSPWLGAFPAIMFAGDQAFLQYAGSSWAYAFSAGMLRMHVPVYALYGLVVLALLGVPTRNAFQTGECRILDRTMLALACWISMAASLRAGAAFLVVMVFPLRAAIYIETFLNYGAYAAMAIFFLLAIYRLWWRHENPPGSALPAASFVSESRNPWQPKRAAIIGALISLAVLCWSFGNDPQMTVPLLLMSIGAFLLPCFVPTFLVYAALAASVLRLLARRDAVAGVALVMTLLPFGFWTAALWSGLSARATERAAIAAIPTSGLPEKIGGIVIDGEDWSMINCARGFVLSADHNVSEVLTHGQSKSQYLKFTRATAKSPVGSGQATDSAPAEYLLIHFPRRSQFLQDKRMPQDSTAPAVEIYSVDPNDRKLVATTYAIYNPLPAFPPMLTMLGWYRGSNTTTSEKSCRNVALFLHRALLDRMS